MALELSQDLFYFLCNSESEAERSGMICGGGWDPPLTHDGINHLRRLSRRMKGNPLSIRTLVCSPLLRAVQAADILHDVLQVKLVALSALSDRNLGAWERKRPHEVSEFDPAAPRIPGGEDYNAFLARVSDGLAAALAQRSKVLIVSQVGVAYALARILLAPIETSFQSGVIYSFIRPERSPTNWQVQTQVSLK